MAAWADPSTSQIVDLKHLKGSDMMQLLEEEVRTWRRRLHWDFSSSAELIRRYVDIKALKGVALWQEDRVVGYCYFILEEHKALIGDLYLLDQIATPTLEQQLLEAVFSEISSLGAIRRVESQLMMLRWPLDQARMRQVFPDFTIGDYTRHLMLVDLQKNPPHPPQMPENIQIFPWRDDLGDEAATLIAESYRGHIDSRINDQYLTVKGTRKFLTNIVLYPGCGHFFEPGSFAARDQHSGKLVGISLGSMVAHGIGHITQICIAPSFQQSGIGSALIRHSLYQLALEGCLEASLTVTSENKPAILLYQHLGFDIIRNFSAYIWERNQSYN